LHVVHEAGVGLVHSPGAGARCVPAAGRESVPRPGDAHGRWFHHVPDGRPPADAGAVHVASAWRRVGRALARAKMLTDVELEARRYVRARVAMQR
jgi:hypothetical protein